MALSALGSARRLPFPTLLVGILGAIVLSSSVTLDLLLLSHDGSLAHDFSAFYAAGLVVRAGGNPYDAGQLAAVEAHLPAVGDPAQVVGFNSYANPPLFAWFMSAMTRLPQAPAYLIWTVVMLAALIAAIVLLGDRRRSALWWLVLVLSPASVICLFLGQQTPLLLLALVGALRAVRRQAPLLAGALLSMAWIKPHLLLPVIVLMVALLAAGDRRRLLAGLGGASLLFAAVSLLLTGPGLTGAWLQTLVAYGRSLDQNQPDLSSLAGLYLSIVGRPWSLLLEGASILVWLSWMVWLVRQAPRSGLGGHDGRLSRAIAVGLAGWLLLLPYVHPHDLVLLAITLPVLLEPGAPGLADATTRVAACMSLIAPEADLLGFRPNFVLSYSVLVPLSLLVALRPWRLDTSGGNLSSQQSWAGQGPTAAPPSAAPSSDAA